MKITVEETKKGWRIYTSKYKTIYCQNEDEVRHKLEVLNDLEKLEKELQYLDRELKKAEID